jgi:predicted RNA methylase
MNVVEDRKANPLIFKNSFSLYASHSYDGFILLKWTDWQAVDE